MPGSSPRPRPLRLGPICALALAAVCVMLACAHSGDKPAGPVIERLELQGVRQVSKREIEKRIATAATGWWWPFATKQYFDPVTWESDLQRIERFYESRGFYQARIVSDTVTPTKARGKNAAADKNAAAGATTATTASTKTPPSGGVSEETRGSGGVALKAVVSEGSPTRVAAVRIDGLDDAGALSPDERDRVEHDLGPRPGNILVEDRWNAAKGELEARLRKLGFAEAKVEGRALVDVTTQQASLLLVARPGPRYRFGDIEVRLGPRSALSPVWIWEQVRLAAPEGQLFSDEALIEAQRRVFAMGLFAVAKVTAGTPDPRAARIPIVVEAREAPFRTLKAGVGVQIDEIRNEGRLILEWSNRNFEGGMRRLTAHAEAGWAFIPNAYAVVSNDTAAGARNGPIARLGLELEQPRFLSRPALRARASLDLERTLEQSYDAIGARLATGVIWQPRSSFSIYPTYNLQGYWLNGPAISSASAAPLTLGCAETATSCFILLSYLEQAITWDRRDSPLEPRNGFYASLSLQEGGGPLGGDFAYLRVLPDLRGYVSLIDGDRLTLAARLRVGELLPNGGQSAVVTRFFGGGGISMRGFNDRRLSPLLLAPPPSSSLIAGAPALLTLPIGGDGMIDGSFEARFRLTQSLVLAVFSDYGQVTQGRIGPDDVSSLLWAVGIGLRYRTPVGPIRVDLARRLQVGRPPPLLAINPMTGAIASMPYQVDDSCFGLGGSNRATVVTDNLCVLHIAIGEAF